MSKPLSPRRWANDISRILITVIGEDRFPVDIKSVAKELSQIKFPAAPITMIAGDELPGFEGALVPKPDGSEWGIIYNRNISSPGRINFTLGHELGHYLLHKEAYPKGFQCSTRDMSEWDSKYLALEHEANIFAASLLMPLDDFRKQIPSYHRPSFSEIGACADKYAVSLLAATLRWLEYTERRSMLVVSTDGFIQWARSSNSAWKSGLFFRTRSVPPVEIPKNTLSLDSNKMSDSLEQTTAWLETSCSEELLVTNQYRFKMTLLHFRGDGKRVFNSSEYEDMEDRYDKTTYGNF